MDYNKLKLLCNIKPDIPEPFVSLAKSGFDWKVAMCVAFTLIMILMTLCFIKSIFIESYYTKEYDMSIEHYNTKHNYRLQKQKQDAEIKRLNDIINDKNSILESKKQTVIINSKLAKLSRSNAISKSFEKLTDTDIDTDTDTDTDVDTISKSNPSPCEAKLSDF